MKTSNILFAFVLTISVEAYSASVQIGDLFYELYDEDQKAVVYSYDEDKNASIRIRAYSEEYSLETAKKETWDIVIPTTIEYKSVTYTVVGISYSAFRDCDRLTSLTIPSSVISIGDWVFDKCYNLEEINVEPGNKNYSSIDGVLFNKDHTKLLAFPCGKQGDYTLPNSVTSIGTLVFFKECVSIDSPIYNEHVFAYLPVDYQGAYEVPEGVQTIASLAFSFCEHMTSVTIPNSVTEIDLDAFHNCTSLTEINVKQGNKNYSSIDGALFNKDQTTLILCVSDGDYPLPSSITSVECYWASCTRPIYNEHVFACLPSSFSGIYEIPSGIKSIAPGAFAGCADLTSVKIPNSVTSIGGGAFSNCSSLVNVIIPNSVTSIGDYAFSNCSGLTNVKIPNSVTSIGERAFSDCSSLKSITIPNSVTSIGYWAFSGVSNVKYRGNAEGAPWGAGCVNGFIDGWFMYNNASKSILHGCSTKATGEITISNKVTSIGDWAFADCSNVISVTIPNSVKSIGNEAFKECSSLKSVIIGNSVSRIGENAFLDCDSLKSVIIGNSVTTIGDGAFYNCSNLISIELPSNVAYIGDWTFFDCSALKEITCKAITPPECYGDEIFGGVDDSIPIYVPKESVELYRTAEEWNLFSNILPIK